MKPNFQKLLGILAVTAVAALTTWSTPTTVYANDTCTTCGGPEESLNFYEASNYFWTGNRIQGEEIIGTWTNVGAVGNPADYNFSGVQEFDKAGIKNKDGSVRELRFCAMETAPYEQSVFVNILHEGALSENSGLERILSGLYLNASFEKTEPLFNWFGNYTAECLFIAGSKSEMMCGLTTSNDSHIYFFNYYVKNQ